MKNEDLVYLLEEKAKYCVDKGWYQLAHDLLSGAAAVKTMIYEDTGKLVD